VAVARYAVNPRQNMAETAVVVHEDYRRLGLAQYLLAQLERHAIKQGIEGFCSEILPTNEAMLGYHRRLGHSLVYSQETDTYHMEFRFKP
jgi:GNAT superfamily N-acetyltransferase